VDSKAYPVEADYAFGGVLTHSGTLPVASFHFWTSGS
jgi:hypothetical protein